MTGEPCSPLMAADWDDAVRAGGGHLLQSWRWGEFKSRFGWDVDRVSVCGGGKIALAQVLFQRRGPVSVGYIPRGPVFPGDDPEMAQELFRQIDTISRRRRALYTLVEPDRALPLTGSFKQHGFIRGPDHIQPERTVKVPLLPDDQLLAQMRQNNRYSVRLAQRRGVEVVQRGAGFDVEDFYRLLHETSDRNRFAIHGLAYYREFLHEFGDDALCIFARIQGNLAAATIAARFGEEATYMYGASSTSFRGDGATFLLQYEVMRWARDAGCTKYDLWGISPEDPESTSDTGVTVARTHGEDWRGLYRFKVGFGGDIVRYPAMLERRYSTVGSFLARRLINRQRGDT